MFPLSNEFAQSVNSSPLILSLTARLNEDIVYLPSTAKGFVETFPVEINSPLNASATA